MLDKNAEERIEQEFEKLNKRLDSLERVLRDNKHKSWGNSIGVLIPVTAIIMWGLIVITHSH